jgi:hypothetical protein
MNSSISSSEAMTHRRFLSVFCGAAMLLIIAVLAVFMVIDPYNTGRLTPINRPGMFETGPRTAHASRMRDTAFNAAVFGNSTIQLLSPDRLNALSGQNFVQFSVPGTGPKEQIAMIDHWVWRRGPAIRTIVLGLESSWCSPSRVHTELNPFPYWLYDTNPLSYARGLFRMDTLEAVPRRIKLLLGREKVARQDGYWDYELIPEGYQKFSTRTLKVPDVPTVAGPEKSAARALAALLSRIPSQTTVLLVHPPVFSPLPPQMTDSGRAAMAACKAEIAKVATLRPGTRLLDFWIDDDNTRNRALFFDHNHYAPGVSVAVSRAPRARHMLMHMHMQPDSQDKIQNSDRKSGNIALARIHLNKVEMFVMSVEAHSLSAYRPLEGSMESEDMKCLGEKSI